MSHTQTEHICKQCGAKGFGNFCSNCGQTYNTARLTMSHLLHEVLHFFTHLDKGFPYTLKRLTTMPGKMQMEYITGHRNKYQKPFSMFFVCGTLTALALYFIHKPTGANISHFEEVRGDFTRHYYVIVQSALLPVYGFITWLLFRNNKINYAESLVLFTYTLSFMLLMVIFTNLIDLIVPDIPSPYYEIPPLFIYLMFTNFNYFKTEPKWRVFIKSLINILIGYFLSNYSGDLAVNWLQ